MRGLVQQREREVEAALHAAGVRRGLAVGGVGEADALEQLVAARAALGARDALQAALQAHVLAAGEHRVQRHVLQRDADRGAHLRALLRDVVARDGRRVPAVGGSSVVSTFTVVDLPAPLGPRKP